jgi:hypothetical protein
MERKEATLILAALIIAPIVYCCVRQGFKKIDRAQRDNIALVAACKEAAMATNSYINLQESLELATSLGYTKPISQGEEVLLSLDGFACPRLNILNRQTGKIIDSFRPTQRAMKDYLIIRGRNPSIITAR